MINNLYSKLYLLYKSVDRNFVVVKIIAVYIFSGFPMQGQVITTIGFDKEAPLVKLHGFNVYHKNRLIRVRILRSLLLAFWRYVCIPFFSIVRLDIVTGTSC